MRKYMEAQGDSIVYTDVPSASKNLLGNKYVRIGIIVTIVALIVTIIYFALHSDSSEGFVEDVARDDEQIGVAKEFKTVREIANYLNKKQQDIEDRATQKNRTHNGRTWA